MSHSASSLRSPIPLTRRWLGRTAYQEGLSIQQMWHQHVGRGAEGLILGTEHSAVITLGRRSRHDDVLWSGTKCQAEGIEICQASRGGQATVHSPGQLVVYPIMPLRRCQVGVRDFVCSLQRSTRWWLNDCFGIVADEGLPEETGIFVKGRKVASLGLRISGGVSYHGLAINVSNDLGLFESIAVCGQRARPMASLKELSSQTTDLKTAFVFWCRYFEWTWWQLAIKREKDTKRPPGMSASPELQDHRGSLIF